MKNSRTQVAPWYVAAALLVGIFVETGGRDWPPSVADVFRWTTLVVFLLAAALHVRNVFARRGTTHAFALLLGAINFILMGGLVVVDRLRHLGDEVTTNTGLSFAAVVVGLWCALVVNSHRFQSGIDRQEEVDFWHPDQEAPKGG